MTDQVQALRELMARATKLTPLPWTITEDCYGGKEEAWCHWHETGPFTMTGEKANDDDRLVIAAINALPGILDQIEALRGERDEQRRATLDAVAESQRVGNALLSRLDQARAENEKLRGLLNRCRPHIRYDKGCQCSGCYGLRQLNQDISAALTNGSDGEGA